MARASSRLFDAGFCSLPARNPPRSVSNSLDQGNIALTDQFSPPILCFPHHLRRAILNPLGLASERMGFSARTGKLTFPVSFIIIGFDFRGLKLYKDSNSKMER